MFFKNKCAAPQFWADGIWICTIGSSDFRGRAAIFKKIEYDIPL